MKLALTFLIILTVGAHAQEFEAGLGPTIHGRCHMDSCGYGTLQTSAMVAKLHDGELYAISGVTWYAEFSPRGDGKDYDFPPTSVSAKKPTLWMAYCSKTRPMMFYYYENKWSASPLRPGDDDAIFGASESNYNDYWASCHHFFPKFANDAVVHKLAPKLGYHFQGGYPDGNLPESELTPADLIKGG